MLPQKPREGKRPLRVLPSRVSLGPPSATASEAATPLWPGLLGEQQCCSREPPQWSGMCTCSPSSPTLGKDILWPGKERMGLRPPPWVPERTVTHLSPLSQRGPGLEIPDHSSQAFPVRWLRLACSGAVLGPEQNRLQHRVFLHMSCPHTHTDPLQSGPCCIGACVDTAWSLRPAVYSRVPSRRCGQACSDTYPSAQYRADVTVSPGLSSPSWSSWEGRAFEKRSQAVCYPRPVPGGSGDLAEDLGGGSGCWGPAQGWHCSPLSLRPPPPSSVPPSGAATPCGQRWGLRAAQGDAQELLSGNRPYLETARSWAEKRISVRSLWGWRRLGVGWGRRQDPVKCTF